MTERDWREAVSAATHLLGMMLSVAGLVLLVVWGAERGPWHVVGFSVFGGSLILLYGASSLYHVLPMGSAARRFFRRGDHLMIFVLIAGTYTPIALVALRGPLGWTLFGLVWGIAALGIGLKVWRIHEEDPARPAARRSFLASRGFSTALYVAMGWVGVVALPRIVDVLSWGAVGWIGLGGVFYTLGAVVYGVKWPDLHPRWFGFHEVFHVLVIGGSLAHWWAMKEYVLPVP